MNWIGKYSRRWVIQAFHGLNDLPNHFDCLMAQKNFYQRIQQASFDDALQSSSKLMAFDRDSGEDQINVLAALLSISPGWERFRVSVSGGKCSSACDIFETIRFYALIGLFYRLS
jgi:hypothetical protein